MVLENVDFNYMLSWFIGIGGFDVILPFLLVFSIIFALLEKIGLFGSGKKNVHMLIALVMGLLVVASRDIVDTINGFLPRVSLVVIIVLMFLVVLGLLLGRTPGFSGIMSWGALIIAIVGVIWALNSAMGYYRLPLSQYITQQDIGILIVLGIIILVVKMITGGELDENKRKIRVDNTRDFINAMFSAYNPPDGGVAKPPKTT
ncbi:hypothetical protein J4403_00660 [Candidatus Woesearchaeota archaeon]|nr:hypothetical protein [Candidatus Woesearchaeota archaeon]